MRKVLIIGLVLFMILSAIIPFSAGLFVSNKHVHENSSDATITIESSSIYEEDEIEEAIDTVCHAFETYPATMTNIYYIEEDTMIYGENIAEQFGASEAIILYCDFHTYDNDEVIEAGFEKDQDYIGCPWILVRNKGESWQLVNSGFDI